MIEPNDAELDEFGLLWAYQLDGKGGGTPIDGGADTPETASNFQWFHIQSNVTGAVGWLNSRGLSEELVENLTVSETRPRTISHSNGTLLVLRGVNTNPGADPEDMVSIRLWFTEKMVISARKQGRGSLAMQDLQAAVEAGVGPSHPGQLISMLVERLADRIGQVVDGIDDDLTRFEVDESLDVREMRRELSVSRRQTASIRRYLAPQREALDTLVRTRGVLSDSDAHTLREQTDRTTRYVEDLDLARERTLVLQEELQNRLAEQQNSRVYLLSIVSAVFLPLSFLTGVFGMNVAGLPGIENPNAFWYLSFWMLLLGIGVLCYMRLRKWL